jgi:REP element-mobilizing transposase RayT
MGRQQRMFTDSGLYRVTVHTAQGRALLTPSAQVNEAIGGVLARGVALSGVKLHGFVVVSDQMHLLVTAEGATLSGFMRYVLGNISKKVGKLVDWTGSFFARRYDSRPVLDDASAEECLGFILSSGVQADLGRRGEESPGLSCLPLLLHRGEAVYRFFHWSRRWQKGVLRKGGEDEWSDAWAERVTLSLTPLPGWTGLSWDSVARRVRALMRAVIVVRRGVHRKGEKQMDLARQSPHRRLKAPRMPNQPLCHAATQKARRSFVAKLKMWKANYARASKRFRQGEMTVPFARWSFRPVTLASDEDRVQSD